MLLTTAHLAALDELAASEDGGQPVYPLTEDDPREHIYHLLELQGMTVLEVPRAYRLTYAGREAWRLLTGMRQEGLLPPNTQLGQGWRFLGSDVLAALQSARRKKGRVGPLTAEMLSTRGFTARARDPEEGTSYLRLNQYGEAWLDFAQRYRPRFEIDGDLANSIHRMHPGYTGKAGLEMPDEHIAQLEAMELLTWSVPDGESYTLTALGQAVYEALRTGGYVPSAAVLDEPTLEVLALLVDKGSAALSSEQLANLQALGYVGLDETLTAAGQAAMQAYAVLQRGVSERTSTFAITEVEVELLAAIHHLAANEGGSALRPDKVTLHRELVDRLARRYRELVGRYGRTIEERSAEKRKALELLRQLENHDEWFSTFWDMEELLVGLEAFDLVRAEGEGTHTVYRLTPLGRKIVEEQGAEPRAVTATAVKAITTTASRFSALATSWVEQAREEGLIGAGGISQAGHFYARLAWECVRHPALTREEAELLVNLPETESEPASPASSEHLALDEEKRAWALEKLEARGLIDRLVDGQLVRTEAGDLLARAVSGAMALGHPVTPRIVRLLAAIRQVGTLYVKERKVRIEPRQWAEVERLSGLGPQEFQETLHLARLGHYAGNATVNEAGLDLLEVQEKLKLR